jgi:hypothetical protein
MKPSFTVLPEELRMIPVRQRDLCPSRLDSVTDHIECLIQRDCASAHYDFAMLGGGFDVPSIFSSHVSVLSRL